MVPPPPCVLGSWSEWSTCLGKVRTRQRVPLSTAGCDVVYGDLQESEGCSDWLQDNASYVIIIAFSVLLCCVVIVAICVTRRHMCKGKAQSGDEENQAQHPLLAGHAQEDGNAIVPPGSGDGSDGFQVPPCCMAKLEPSQFTEVTIAHAVGAKLGLQVAMMRELVATRADLPGAMSDLFRPYLHHDVVSMGNILADKLSIEEIMSHAKQLAHVPCTVQNPLTGEAASFEVHKEAGQDLGVLMRMKLVLSSVTPGSPAAVAASPPLEKHLTKVVLRMNGKPLRNLQEMLAAFNDAKKRKQTTLLLIDDHALTHLGPGTGGGGDGSRGSGGGGGGSSRRSGGGDVGGADGEADTTEQKSNAGNVTVADMLQSVGLDETWGQTCCLRDPSPADLRRVQLRTKAKDSKAASAKFSGSAWKGFQGGEALYAVKEFLSVVPGSPADCDELLMHVHKDLISCNGVEVAGVGHVAFNDMVADQESVLLVLRDPRDMSVARVTLKKERGQMVGLLWKEKVTVAGRGGPPLVVHTVDGRRVNRLRHFRNVVPTLMGQKKATLEVLADHALLHLNGAGYDDYVTPITTSFDAAGGGDGAEQDARDDLLGLLPRCCAAPPFPTRTTTVRVVKAAGEPLPADFASVKELLLTRQPAGSSLASCEEHLHKNVIRLDGEDVSQLSAAAFVASVQRARVQNCDGVVRLRARNPWDYTKETFDLSPDVAFAIKEKVVLGKVHEGGGSAGLDKHVGHVLLAVSVGEGATRQVFDPKSLEDALTAAAGGRVVGLRFMEDHALRHVDTWGERPSRAPSVCSSGDVASGSEEVVKVSAIESYFSVFDMQALGRALNASGVRLQDVDDEVLRTHGASVLDRSVILSGLNMSQPAGAGREASFSPFKGASAARTPGYLLG